MKLSLFSLTALLLLMAAPAARSQTLPGGLYRGSAEVGPVLLDGRYPLIISELPGYIEVSTGPRGTITGRAMLFGAAFPITGQLVSRKAGVRVILRANVDRRRFLLKATLSGSAFAGTVQFGRLRTTCQFDAGPTGPIRAQYAVTLSVGANGNITGPGTLTCGGKVEPVRVIGRAGKSGRATLTIKSAGTFLRIPSGQIGAGTLTAPTWTAQGFGALLKGSNLTLALDDTP